MPPAGRSSEGEAGRFCKMESMNYSVVNEGFICYIKLYILL